MTSDPTGAALLRTVCLDPDDVDARLVYADWLEQEGGEPERGEFIRVQVELERCRKGPCGDVPDDSPWLTFDIGYQRLRRRERELWPREGVIGGLVGGNGVRWEYRRGFVEAVACTAEQWERHGPAVVLAQPVREVRLSDREPNPWISGDYWAWHHVVPDFDLPYGVSAAWLELMTGHNLCGSTFKAWTSRQAALDALSSSCVTWARRKAGLDVPCVECWDFLKCSRKPGWAACPDCKGAGWVTAR